MSERWTWTAQAADGTDLTTDELATAFPTQAEAEAWFGETWMDLAERGVSAVTLHRDGAVVYAPMSLEA